MLILQPRLLSSEDIGLTRVLFSFSFLISTFIPLGSGNLINRYFPVFKDEKSKNHGILGLVFLSVFVGFVFCSLGLLFFADFIKATYQEHAAQFSHFYYLIIPFALINTIIAVFNVYCYALFKSYIPSLLNDIGIKILNILVFVMYYFGYISHSTMVYAYIGTFGLQALILSIYALKIAPFTFIPDFRFIQSLGVGKIYKYLLIFVLASFASYGIRILDSIVLAKYIDLEQVGIYVVIAFIPTFIEAPLNAVEKIVNPKYSYALAANNLALVEEFYKKSCKYLMLIGGALLICIIADIEMVMQFLPAKYSTGLSVVYIMTIGSVINLFTGTNTAIIFNSDNYVAGASILVSILVFSVVINFILIPIWGMNGAALATASATVLYNLAKMIYIHYKFKIHPYSEKSFSILIITLLVAAIAYFFPNIENIYMNLVVKTGCLLVFFSVLLIFTKSFNMNELSFFKK